MFDNLAEERIKKLTGKRILITGGTGFVGYWLGKVFANIQSLNIDGYYCDWDAQAWDYIIHAAPVGVERVIECAGRCGARVLFTSSGAVCHNLSSKYAQEKYRAENKLLASGINCSIARLYTFAGAGLRPGKAITDFISQAKGGGPISILGDGMTVRSYLYGEDMAIWLWRILLSGGYQRIYNVGSEQPTNIWQLANEVAGNFVPPPEIVIQDKIDVEPIRYYVPDTHTTREELGVCQWTPFSEAVRRMVLDA